MLVAATWNVLGGASALFAPAQHFAQLYTASLSLVQPIQLFFYRCTWINVMAWGLAYLLAAFLPSRRTTILAAGAAGKFVYCLAGLSLFSTGVGKAMLLAAGLVDVLLSALFVLAPGLSERQAADTVRRCLEWQYALALPCAAPGFRLGAGLLGSQRLRQ